MTEGKYIIDSALKELASTKKYDLADTVFLT